MVTQSDVVTLSVTLGFVNDIRELFQLKPLDALVPGRYHPGGIMSGHDCPIAESIRKEGYFFRKDDIYAGGFSCRVRNQRFDYPIGVVDFVIDLDDGKWPELVVGQWVL